MPTIYTIIINEEQRVAILELIKAAKLADAPGQPLEYWEAMLANLPAEELDTPGVHHGFCL
jgi:hypothetical protein